MLYIAGILLYFSLCSIHVSQPGVDQVLISTPGTVTTPGVMPLKNMFGINAYEWNFLEDPAQPNNRTTIYEANMAVIKSFSAVRHYLNWNKLENTEGNYTFNPTNDGSWDYDLIYTRCKQDSIFVLADLKNCPRWMMATYPANQQDNENAPALYGSDLSKPDSYIQQARTAFQFAARYGYNTAVNPELVKVDTRPRWANDRINEVKIGMGLISYIECNNEPNRWWKGSQTHQTAEQYAANLSAFYDGDEGRLGKNAGVKTADPNMKVVIGGLATSDPAYINTMIEWCKRNRGYKADGSVNLCFDVINYHFYSSNADPVTHKGATMGIAPELSLAGSIANSFVQLGKQYHLPVWITEAGYDINQQSYQKAIPIGNKPALLTQADWILRTALLYMRHGIQRLFFYQLFDDKANSTTQYGTSGLAENARRRPAADYILQTSHLMGDYVFAKTINADPLVDVYQDGKKTMYVLTVPDQQGRTANYNLILGKVKKAAIYHLKPGADVIEQKTVPVVNGQLKITATETPVFVQAE
jgi:hypothetical protein